MQVLGYLDRHHGEEVLARSIGAVIDMEERQASSTVRGFRRLGLVEDKGMALTADGRRMLWGSLASRNKAV